MASLSLLAIQCKKADAVDLKTPVYSYIANTYSEQQARDAEEDLAAAQEERNEVSGLTGSLSGLATTLQKYAAPPKYPARRGSSNPCVAQG